MLWGFGRIFCSLLLVGVEGFVYVRHHEVACCRAAVEAPPPGPTLTFDVGSGMEADVLYEGDFVVHYSRGVCVYAGRYGNYLGGEDKRPILLKFADKVVAVDATSARTALTLLKRGSEIQKGDDDDVAGMKIADESDGDDMPKLSRLKAPRLWKVRREKAIAASKEHARHLLTTMAARHDREREACEPLTELQNDLLVSGLGFELTEGQLQCMRDVEEDMCRRSRPMDRLVFGDVGFGKTEVALRAVALAVANGRQAAVVAPTTILASQHFSTLTKRLGPLNVTVDLCLGAGRSGRPSATNETKKKKKMKPADELRQRMASGEANVVVGTHSLLSDRQHWRKLGLAVIDEEQRFGVAQKDKLKQYCVDVDVLSLSATPIPRTLAGALTGIRDVSELPAPPRGRGRTTTLLYPDDPGFPPDDLRLAQVLKRERARGGQSFYVVPFVADVDNAVRRVSEALGSRRDNVPKILVAHGRCRDPASVVAEFAKGNNETTPVLVATTLVENGLDLPKVNTIVVQDSHRFGLATLHQLRGRVGRGGDDAVCCLTHPRDNQLTRAAEARLKAMTAEATAGPDLARRDLEIRGAGEILGTKQSGRAARFVGGRLYSRILREEIERIRALDVVPVDHCDLTDFFSTEEDDFSLMLSEAKDVDSVKALASEVKGSPSRKRQLKLALLERHAARLGFSHIALEEDKDEKQDAIIAAPTLRPESWILLKREVPERLRESLRFDEPRRAVIVVRLGALEKRKRLDFLLEVFLHMTTFLDRVRVIHSTEDQEEKDAQEVEDIDDDASSSSGKKKDEPHHLEEESKIKAPPLVLQQ